jgi:hypothetical protein
MKFSVSRSSVSSFFLLICTLFFSCTKIAITDIGSDLIPPVDGVTTKDTVLEVTSKNSGYDTIAVGISDDHILGYVNDNLFGTTTASVNFQIAPSFTPFTFGIPKDSIVLDSVVLCFSYKGFWGDSSQHLKLRVFTIDPEEVFTNNIIYNNKKVFEKGKEITQFGIAKDVDITALTAADTTFHYGEPIANQLRIKLDNSFGQVLINLDSVSAYRNDSTFYNYVRGLIVQPEAGNALIRVNLGDTLTRLSVYYHSKDLKDTFSRRYVPNVLTSASSNAISRDYSNTQIPAYINSPDTADNLVFMQTSPGTFAKLKIPSVLGMQNVIVHRAELLMYQVPDLSSNNDNLFTAPNLFLSAYSNDSAKNFAVPYDINFSTNSISNLVQFGVFPKSYVDKKTGRNSLYYSFDITRYVQSIVTNHNKLYDFILQAPYNQYVYLSEQSGFAVPISSPALNTVGTGRIRLGGGNNDDYKMRLHIVYSLL